MNHGWFLVGITAQGALLPGGEVWCCRHCDRRGKHSIYDASSTSSTSTHLAKEHSIFRPQEDQANSSDVLALQQRASLSIPQAKEQVLKQLAVAFLVNSDDPFTTFEDPYLKSFLKIYNRDLATAVALGRNTLTSVMMKMFEEQKAVVLHELHEALTSIHISFDLWTSPNHLAFIAVFAHFLSSKQQYTSRLIAFRRHPGAHSGEHMSNTLQDILQAWDIPSKLGVIVCDNASNNDTCLQAIYPRLIPEMTGKDVKHRRMRCFGHVLNLVAKAFLFGNDADTFELESDSMEILEQHDDALLHWRRKGPVGKLHNIVKFIRASPQRSEAFRQAAESQDLDDLHDSFTLHAESTAELELRQDNATRWNSTFLMIDRAWKKQRDIQAYILQLQLDPTTASRIDSRDVLDADDWRLLAEIRLILEPIYLMTMRAQGHTKGNGYGQLWEVMTGMEYILEQLEDWRALYLPESEDLAAETIDLQASLATSPDPDPYRQPRLSTRPSRPRTRRSATSRPASRHEDRASRYQADALPRHATSEYLPNSGIANMQPDERAYIRASINNAWLKLDEYYNLLGDSPLFAAAVILHPGFGLPFLEEAWSSQEHSPWLGPTKLAIRAYFEHWYPDFEDPFDLPLTSPSPSPSPLSSTSSTTSQHPKRETSRFIQWINNKRSRPLDSHGELERYYLLAPQECSDPIQWWLDHQPTFPRLSRFALDLLVIPAMADDPERAFSQGKLTLTSQRHRLGEGRIEALQILKNWLKNKVIQVGGIVTG